MNTVISKRNEEVQIPRKLLFACVLVIKTSVLSDAVSPPTRHSSCPMRYFLPTLLEMFNSPL